MQQGLVIAPVVAAMCGCALTAAPAAEAPRPPNFVIMFADDMGYGDIGCFGHPTIHTPELDRMAAEGLKLTEFYVAAAVCTPSRAGLLTGRLPIRSGMAGNPTGGSAGALWSDSKGGLPQSEITIATALKAQGYATACIGKWHLGHVPDFLPTRHGFDEYFGLPYSNGQNHTGGSGRGRGRDSVDLDGRIEWWNEPLMRGEEIIEQPADQRTLTQRYTAEAIRFIEARRDQPFFLYLPYTMPHVPLFASAGFHGKSARGRYGDTVEEIDWSVGQVRATLQRLGLAENTLVIFTTDNGPWLTKGVAGGSAGLLRDGKSSTWEGGFRVPAIACWPGTIRPARVSSQIANAMDLFTTLLTLAGAPIPADRPIDGVDLGPLLLETGTVANDTVYYYRGVDLYALRKGPYKAHFITFDGYSDLPPQRRDPPLLYHLGHDPAERFDIAADQPDIVAELTALARRHFASVKPGEPVIESRGRPPMQPRERWLWDMDTD
jgi:arylsulfatase A-like enzyme